MSEPRPLGQALAWHFAFAALAIALNVASQWLVIQIGTAILGSSALLIFASILVGTGAGLVAKYLCDKLFIYQQTLSVERAGGLEFLIYTATGIGTTLLFWAIEYAFHFATGTDTGRYIGAVIGLTIGYTLKFFMDRRWVFNQAPRAV